MGTTVDYADEILTVKELGKKLKLGRDKTYSLVRSDGFPSVKLGGRYGTVHTGDTGYLSIYDTDHSDFAMRIINETQFKQSNGAITTVLALCTVD